jgi:hydroxyacylglutathione hydrolase
MLTAPCETEASRPRRGETKERRLATNVHQFLCLTDNYGVLLHDSSTGATASIDAPEAGPIFAALEQKGWTLTHLLITHHHADHVQGAPELKARFPDLEIIGPAKDAARIGFLESQVREGDVVRVASLAARVIETPGHTIGHIAYHFEEDALAFCGDTIFSLGCGRAFETPYAVLWSSLVKLAALPGETQVYCGHEYTQANARFALTIEPDNPVLQARAEEVARLRAENRPTLPTTIAAELAANPFLRAEKPSVQAAVGMVGADPEEVFAELRARKDRF